MRLLLDLGNSRLKWAAADAAGRQAAQALAWDAEALESRLLAAWQVLETPAAVSGACVAGVARRQWLERLLAQCGWPAPTWLISPLRRGAVVNAYPAPAQLGIDRFLALLAAWREGCAPCVIAGCGSALTLDALAADGQHTGGLIVPGVRAMWRGLALAAPALPPPSDAPIAVLADNTRDAIAFGAWQALAASIERFHTRQQRQFGESTRLMLVGGDAAALAGLLDRPAVLRPDAVLDGLLAWHAMDGANEHAR
ncbi:MAG TPA: type III pantothenate kinase [Rhodanobacteraceae bacterium]|nr:type III pantothenate kinase [Rhodanobacteraceae bacterium]